MIAFARFWYRFFVGDDWTVAAGVVIALAATALTGLWWITPVAAVGLLAISVHRAERPADRRPGDH